MKKTLLALFAPLLFLPAFVFAQNMPSAPTHQVKSYGTSSVSTISAVPVSISDIVVSSLGNRSFKISFALNNQGSAEPDVRYGLILSTTGKNGAPVDEQVYSRNFSLDANASVNDSINYAISPLLPAGSYQLAMIVADQSGAVLGSTALQEITVGSTTQPSLEIVPDSCALLVSGNKQANTIAFASATDTLSVSCAVMSTFPQSISFTPVIEIKIQNEFGATVSTSTPAEPITLKNGTNTVVIPVKNESSPQHYYISFALASLDGGALSNTVSLGYDVRGLVGTIQKTTFDKSIYQEGDTALLTTTFSAYLSGSKLLPTGTRFQLATQLMDGKGNACAAQNTTTSTSGAAVLPMRLQIMRNCANPTATIVLSAVDQNGSAQTLDTKTFAMITPAQYMNPSLGNMLLAGVLILIILIILFIIMKRMKKKAPVSALLIGIVLVLSFGFSGHTAFANTCYPGTVDPAANANGNGSGYFICEYIGGNSAPNLMWHDGSGAWSSFYGVSVSGGLDGSGNTWLIWPKNPGSVYNSGVVLGDNGSSNNFYHLNFIGSQGASGGSAFTTKASISAGASAVSSGQSTTISWNSAGANSCDIWQDGVMVHQSAGTSGSVSSGPLTHSSTFTVYCGFWAPTGSASVTVTVTGTSISASPNPVPLGSPTNLSWTSTGMTACSVRNMSTNAVLSTATSSPIIFGSYGSGNGQLANPFGVALDSSKNVYVADTANNRIEKFSPSGAFLQTIGSSINLKNPYGVAVDASGNILVADTGNNRIQEFNPGGTLINTIGGPGTGNGLFDTPYDLAFDSSGRLYVADTNNSRVEQFVPSGGTYVYNNFQFPTPGNGTGIAIDSSNNIYVVDFSDRQVDKFNSSGNLIANFGSAGSGNGQFTAPFGITLDSLGNIYVADNDHIDVFGQTNGTSTYLFSLSGGLGNPRSVVMDSSGDLYASDYSGNLIKRFNMSGNLTGTTTFAVGCNNNGNGQSTSTVAVGVNGVPNVLLSANPQIVNVGGQTNLTYSTQNANSWSVTSVPNVYSANGTGNVSQSANTSPMSQLTTFTLTASGPNGTNSTSTTVQVGVAPQTPTNVNPVQSGCKINVSWTSPGNAPAFAIYRSINGSPYVLIQDQWASTTYNDSYSFSNTTYSYEIKAEANGLQSSTSSPGAVSYSPSLCALPPVVTSCSVSQTNGPSGNQVYANKQMTWTLNTSLTPASTTWTGTNTTWSGTKTILGSNSNTVTNIYTTVGPKLIYATTSDAVGSIASCVASTTVILDQGTNQEI